MKQRPLSGLWDFDQSWRERGFLFLAGVDEAGVGPWAGPVAAAAVVFPAELRWDDLNDSKKCSPTLRDDLEKRIKSHALSWSVVLMEPAVIDSINILEATRQAMREALSRLSPPASHALVDGNRSIPQCLTPHSPIVKGDQTSASIAAASILAKTARDAVMRDLHEKFPQYGFDRHKGYGTDLHQKALQQHGPCLAHRLSYAPVRALTAAAT